ncbi:hypothetical protein [Lactococcus lactis]|uniref:hypothetical protein n=1 Tax=Lactococcus lactis TaxID=1358 RepID=UPI00163D80AB|nr:hypothetical protein [Lactococcus lactis]
MFLLLLPTRDSRIVLHVHIAHKLLSKKDKVYHTKYPSLNQRIRKKANVVNIIFGTHLFHKTIRNSLLAEN